MRALKGMAVLLAACLLTFSVSSPALGAEVKNLSTTPAAFSISYFKNAVALGKENTVVSPVSAFLGLSLAARLGTP